MTVLINIDWSWTVFWLLTVLYRFIDRENELRQSKPPAPQPQRVPLDPWARSKLCKQFAPPKEDKSSGIWFGILRFYFNNFLSLQYLMILSRGGPLCFCNSSHRKSPISRDFSALFDMGVHYNVVSQIRTLFFYFSPNHQIA